MLACVGFRALKNNDAGRHVHEKDEVLYHGYFLKVLNDNRDDTVSIYYLCA